MIERREFSLDVKAKQKIYLKSSDKGNATYLFIYWLTLKPIVI
jgi:hypothetical protein